MTEPGRVRRSHKVAAVLFLVAAVLIGVLGALLGDMVWLAGVALIVLVGIAVALYFRSDLYKK